MLGTIFQLSAAFLFGFQIAFRNKKAIKESVKVIITVYSEGKQQPTKAVENAYLARNIYLIGIIYLIAGYLIPLTKYDISLEHLVDLERIFLIVFFSIILVYVGNEIAKIMTRRNIEKF